MNHGPDADPRPSAGPSGGAPAWSVSALARATGIMRTRRRALGYSQLDFAVEFGYSPRHYQSMESGGKISPASMYALGRQLQMSPYEWAQFFHFLTGDTPYYGLTVDEGRTVGEGLKRVTTDWAKVHIHRQDNPAVLMDGCWNVEHFNTAFAAIYESVQPHLHDHPLVNPMRFCLFHPDAPLVYGDWEETWLVPALCEFAHQFYLHPDNPELQSIRDRVRRDDRLEDIYLNRVSRQLIEHGIDAVSHGDVLERLLLVPGRGTQPILVTQGHPWFGRHHGYLMWAFSPLEGADRPLLAHVTADAAPAQASPGPSQAHAKTSAPRPHPHKTPSSAKPPALRARSSAEFSLTVGQLIRHYREKTPYSQEQFAHGAGLPFSHGTYVKYERGKELPKKEYHDALTKALGMPAPVKQLFLSMVMAGEPPTLAVRSGPETADRTRRWVDVHLADHRQTSPSVLMDGAWHVEYCNAAYEQLFAHVPADPRNHPLINPFRYVVFHEEAQQTLADWYDVWLVPWLVELGMALHRDNPHPEHLALHREIDSDSFLRDTFNSRVMRDLQGGGVTVGFESDGDIRGMQLPIEYDDGTTGRRYVPMLVTAGVPQHLKKIGALYTTMTPWT